MKLDRVNQRGIIIPILMALLLVVILAVSILLAPREGLISVAGLGDERLDFRGAMLRVMLEVKHRRIKLAPGMAQIIKLDGHNVMIKRQENQKSETRETVGLYLVEGLSGQRGELGWQRMQLAFADFAPFEHTGDIRIGFWQKRQARR